METHDAITVAFGDYATAGRTTPRYYWVEFRTKEYPPEALVLGEEKLAFSTTAKMTPGLVPPQVPPQMDGVRRAMREQAGHRSEDPDATVFNPRENVETWAMLWVAYLLKQGYSFAKVKSFSDSGWALGKRLAELCGANGVERVAPLFQY